jgi:hypothetical protein
MSTKRLRTLFLLLAGIPLLAAALGANQNPRVIPPDAAYRGLTYGEWAAEWWRAVLAAPVEGEVHPLFTGGAVEGEKGIVFLASPVLPAGSPIAEFAVTITPGTPLFFPLLTAACSVFEDPPFHGDDEPSLRACANDLLDLVSDLSAQVDGRPLNNLDAYRVESPLFRWGPLPADNALGAPEGTESDAVAAGYYLMLPPLSVGVHEITTRAAIDSFGLAVDARVIVTVKPRGQ